MPTVEAGKILTIGARSEAKTSVGVIVPGIGVRPRSMAVSMSAGKVAKESTYRAPASAAEFT
jgi:hypothetical protein